MVDELLAQPLGFFRRQVQFAVAADPHQAHPDFGGEVPEVGLVIPGAGDGRHVTAAKQGIRGLAAFACLDGIDGKVRQTIGKTQLNYVVCLFPCVDNQDVVGHAFSGLQYGERKQVRVRIADLACDGEERFFERPDWLLAAQGLGRIEDVPQLGRFECEGVRPPGVRRSSARPHVVGYDIKGGVVHQQGRRAVHGGGLRFGRRPVRFRPLWRGGVLQAEKSAVTEAGGFLARILAGEEWLSLHDALAHGGRDIYRMELAGNALELHFSDRGAPALHVFRGVLGQHLVVECLHAVEALRSGAQSRAGDSAESVLIWSRLGDALRHILAHVFGEVLFVGHVTGDCFAGVVNWAEGRIFVRAFFADDYAPGGLVPADA